MIHLDGSQGGGQILRSALSLSMVTGQPFRLTSIRGKRPKPGLMRQHLTCVKAALEVSQGVAYGAELGSKELIFRPGEIRAGEYHFAIGSAGSTTLLAQTLLPALWSAEGESRIVLEGGTHNPLAPSMDFITRVYLPLLKKAGVTINGTLQRFGFAPAGGGKITFTLPGGQTPKPIELLERGNQRAKRIHCLCCNIREEVAQKETNKLFRSLEWPEESVEITHTTESDGPGNTLAAEVQFEHVTELVTSFGAYGKPAANVAKDVLKMMKNYLGSGAVVGRQLSDQLLLPMSLGAGGAIITMKPTNHVVTNIETIKAFLPVEVTTGECGDGLWEVRVKFVSII